MNRARRDEWVRAGIFDSLTEEALAGFDKIVGIDVAKVSIGGSMHKASADGQEARRDRSIEARTGETPFPGPRDRNLYSRSGPIVADLGSFDSPTPR